ncbi:Phosphoesterase family protein [Xenococcus sp. PCC 7305]|uniref:Phosphoesterase family protein n=1 Tax=Xenococcus sp. PCC 7305 TaxID=102125 RepID=UPI0002ABF0CF|nr:Phosphoesterase family protein [Xenococcus sp. PCC 7305]ELS05323.1 Phosphoesterase family protein [Xenococcus sp. PCC 7305]
MGLAFERIVIVMLENSIRSNVLANSYMDHLRQKGVFLSNSYGVTHSSQPNYIASIGGDNFGFINDDPGYVQWIYNTMDASPVTSVVDLLEAQGLTWRSYAEDLPPNYKKNINPNPPYTPIPPNEGNFARKHVPFLSFPNIISVPERLANIVDGKEFAIDLENGNLPHYSWFTPNLINDGHSLKPEQKATDPNDTNRHVNIKNIEAFLKEFLSDDPIAKFPPETLIVITFDEAYPYYDPYEIYTLLIGDMIPAGTTRTEPYNHYSLLRSVEKNFGLGTLKRNDAAAMPYWFLQE